MPSFLKEKKDQAVCCDGSYTDPDLQRVINYW